MAYHQKQSFFGLPQESLLCLAAKQVSAGGETTAAAPETLTFKIYAEIYRVLAELQHAEGSDLTIDWGHVRGVDPAAKQIILVNKGRFPYNWQAAWKKQVSSRCLQLHCGHCGRIMRSSCCLAEFGWCGPCCAADCHDSML